MKCLRYSLAVLSLLVLSVVIITAAERKEFIATVGNDGVQRVEITGGSYFFDPNYIIVKVNTPVEMKIRKESGLTPHDFVLKAPEAGMDVQANLGTDPTIVRFKPSKTGMYPFYCSKKIPFLGSHREKGMEGVLDVRE